MDAGQKVTWDCIYFGSYPQAEVITSKMSENYTALSKSMLADGDLVVSDSIYASLEAATGWDENNDITIGGRKYRRMKKADATYGTSGSSVYYNWSDATSYHYFRYEAIKWRVLQKDGDQALLLSDRALDDQKYHLDHESVTWESSTIRSWLNGYGAGSNQNGVDYSSKNFLDSAFTASEQDFVATTKVENKDNLSCGTEGGNDTSDEVFLLSESQVYRTDTAVSYGFVKDSGIHDEGRRSKSSVYAKAMGTWSSISTANQGNCDWWLRSPGYYTYCATRVNSSGYVDNVGYNVYDKDYGVRPALYLNLSSSQWSYAGKVCSDGTENEVGGDDQYIKVSVKDGEYAIYVTDSSGEPVPDAKVTFAGTEKVTDASGTAVFSRSTVEDPKLTVTCDGYKPYSNADEDYEKSENGYEYVILYSEKESDCKLKSARYKGGIRNVSLLSETKRLSLTNSNANLLDDGKFSLICRACDPSKAKRYDLYQGTAKIASSTDGNFRDLAISQFSEGGKVKVHVTGQDGTVAITKINLSFTDDAAVKDTYFKLSDSISFAVSEDVPFVGNTTVKMKLPEDIPVELQVSDGKIYGGINIEVWNKDGKKSVKEQYQDAKKKMKQAVKAASMNIDSKTTKKELQKLLKNKGKSTFPLDTDASLSVCGFIEGDWNEKGMTQASGTVYFLLEGSAKKNFQFVAYAVPVTVQIKGEASGKLEGKLEYDFNKSVFSGNATFAPGIGMEVFGGIGVKGLVGGGAYGSGRIDMDFALLGTNGNFKCNTVDLTGELGAKLYFASWEAKKSFAYNTWPLYSRTNGTRSLAEEGTAQEEEWMQGLYSKSQYELSDTSYLSGESSWNAGRAGRARSRSMDSSEFQTLLSGTYRNSAPVLASDGAHMVLAFNKADTAQNEYNQSRVSYSVFDADTNSWSAPSGLGQEGVSSGFIRTSGGGEGIYLACLQADQAYADDWNGDMEEYASSLQVCVSRYDSEAGAFEDLTVLSDDNTLYEHAVDVGTLDGVPTAVWVANKDFEIYGQNSTNMLRYSQYVDGAWTEPKEILTGLHAVTGLSMGSMGGSPYIAYATDGDNDLGTADDVTVSICTLDGDSQKIATGSVSAPSFAVMPDTGLASLIYIENGTLAATTDGAAITHPMEGAVTDLNSTYIIDGSTLYYASATQKASNLYKVVYNKAQGAWSEPIQITDQEQYLDNLGIASVNGDTYCTGMLKQVTIAEDDVEDDSDLVWKKLDASNNLTLLSAVYQQEDVAGGGELPITLEVRNNGDQQVDALSITVTDGKGAVLLEKEQEVDLAPSGESSFDIGLVLPDQMDRDTYTVRIENADGSSDADEQDDTKELGIGYCDLQLSEELTVTGDSRILSCKIENVGMAASGGTLDVYAPDNSEEPVYSVSLDPLESGQSQIISMDLGDQEYPSGTFTAVATADQEEFFTENNTIMRSVDLTKGSALAITSQPEDYTGAVGDTASFTVGAAGEGLTYQWQFSNDGGASWRNSSQSGNKTDTIQVPVTEARDGQQYRCIVTDENGNCVTSEAGTLIAAKEALAITSQPEDYTGAVGETASFTVGAAGEGLTYQWQFSNDGGANWRNSSQSGCKTATVSVPITKARNGQQYRCVVTDGSGNRVTSEAGTLIAAKEALAIISQPEDYTGAVGETAVFTVEASGEGLRYQWQYSNDKGVTWKNSSQSGCKTATVSVPITEARNGQQYRCVVTDGSGNSVISEAGTLIVGKEALEITSQPKDYTGAVGDTAVFTVEASGEGLRYQWQYSNDDGANWKNSSQSGCKTATVSVPITAARNGQQYRCVVTDGSGNCVTSEAGTLIVQ
ncbi:hypothetical protein BHF69_08505 [Anaerostipes sp. 992a]|nr:hypothetical protein BHF69_08505 [Anaerostipes sp. 992a]